MKKKVQFTGGAENEGKAGGSPDPASTTKASEEPSQPKKEQTNKLSFHQLRQMASDMPSNVAVKLQGRSLASIG